MRCLPHRRELEDRLQGDLVGAAKFLQDCFPQRMPMGLRTWGAKLALPGCFGGGSSQLRACRTGVDLEGEGSLSPEVCKPDSNLHHPKCEPPAPRAFEPWLA